MHNVNYILFIGWVLILPLFTVNAQEVHSNTYRAKYKVNHNFRRLDLSGKIISYQDSVMLQSDKGSIDSIIKNIASGRKGLKSNIHFEKNKIYVNPYPVFDEEGNVYIERDASYYYELENRQSVSLRFSSFSIKALSVPLKVRIGSDQYEFSSDANLGAFGGFSWGKTKITHMEHVGKAEKEIMRTVGILIGTESLEFSFRDVNNENVDVETAVISVGAGFIYSYQKFTAGLTGGLDYALGENSSEWDYHGRPWIGIAIGYSLFSF